MFSHLQLFHCLFHSHTNASVITKKALPSRRAAPLARSIEGEEERRSPFEYQAQFQWRGETRTVDSRHSGGCAWASVREFHIKAPASSSASDTLCLNDTVSPLPPPPPPPPVFSRKHFPAVEIKILVYGSDSSFQNVPDRWGAPYNGECLQGEFHFDYCIDRLIEFYMCNYSALIVFYIFSVRFILKT